MADDTNQLRVRLVTPERILFESSATAVELPSKNGYFEVLYGHAPLMAELGAGDVRIHTGAGIDSSAPDSTRYNVSWGFVEVLPDRVTILASTLSSPKRSTPSAPSSSSTAATSCGTKPAKANRPTMKRSASSTKPKPSWPRRRKNSRSSTAPGHHATPCSC